MHACMPRDEVKMREESKNRLLNEEEKKDDVVGRLGRRVGR